MVSDGLTSNVVEPLVVSELAAKPDAPGSAPKTNCLSSAAPAKVVAAAGVAVDVALKIVGSPGPRISDGRPIWFDELLTPVTLPICRKASGSALLARTMLVRII